MVDDLHGALIPARCVILPGTVLSAGVTAKRAALLGVRFTLGINLRFGRLTRGRGRRQCESQERDRDSGEGQGKGGRPLHTLTPVHPRLFHTGSCSST